MLTDPATVEVRARVTSKRSHTCGTRQAGATNSSTAMSFVVPRTTRRHCWTATGSERVIVRTIRVADQRSLSLQMYKEINQAAAPVSL